MTWDRSRSGTPEWSPRIQYPHDTLLPCYEDDLNRCGCPTCIDEPQVHGKRPVSIIWDGTVTPDTTIRTVQPCDPLREQAAQLCDEARAQVEQWAREVVTAQDTIGVLRAENEQLRAERDTAIGERDVARAVSNA